MNPSFQKRFGELVEELAGVFNVFPSPGLGRGIWKVMEDGGIENHEFEAAVERAMREWDKYHPPSVLKNLAYAERRRIQGLMQPKEAAPEPRGQLTPEWLALKAQLDATNDGLPLDEIGERKDAALKGLKP